jgi:hypothetical protein
MEVKKDNKKGEENKEKTKMEVNKVQKKKAIKEMTF